MSVEQYYHDWYHSDVREKLYILLNKATKSYYAKTKNRNISEAEKQQLFKEIEGIIKDSILRVDWEHYDIKNSITPFPFN